MPVLSTETKNSKSVTCNHGTDGGDLCRERERAWLKWREENRADFQSVRLLTTASVQLLIITFVYVLGQSVL